jgi:hypothetical protein
MTRSDIPNELLKLAESKNAERPLLAKPFEAYRFDRVPPSGIRLAAERIDPKMTADVQAILKITDATRSLDARLAFQVKDRPTYRLQAYLPDDFRIDHVLPADLDYSVAAKDGRRLLSVFLPNGRSGRIDVRIQGVIGKSAADQVALPRIEAFGVEQQRIELAVQASDAFDLEAVELKNCERVSASRLYGWLNPEQRPLTKMTIESCVGDYAGAIKLVPKKPEIACDTLTNVRVTDRAIEETILLDYNIKNAGARSFSFVLPWWMKDAKINVPFLREKSNEPLEPGEKSPRLVKIDLQVEATGLFRVLVENDRQLENTRQETPIPTVNGVSGGRRFVTLESFGRDEVLVENDQLSGMEKLVQGQKDWNRLKELLDVTATFAYLAENDAKSPKLVYRTVERMAVQTAGARVLLADTFLFLDDNGAYRAKQTFRLFNSTEQFLEIELPLGAELWTAIVAGEPVKPVRENAKDPRGVKIPLVKTAAGDLDYEVVLGYGGTMAEIGNLSTVEFPLPRCVNLQPEQSIVQLSLRKDRQWFDFNGTMSQTDEAGANACRVATNTKVTENLRQTLSQSSRFGKMRTAASLRQQVAVHTLLDDYDANAEVRGEIEKSNSALAAAIKEAEEVEKTPEQGEAASNRGKVRDRFWNQNVEYAGKKLAQTGGNWGDSSSSESQAGTPGQTGQQFNGVWLTQNKLSYETPPSEGLERNKLGEKSEKLSGLSKGGHPAIAQKPSSAQIVEGKAKRELAETNTVLRGAGVSLNDIDREQSIQTERYRMQLESRQVQTANPVANNAPGYGPRQPVSGPTVAGSGVLTLDIAKQPAPAQDAFAAQGTAVQLGQPPQLATQGLASLNFELPSTDDVRWKVYSFTTPRGNVEITARSFSDDLLGRAGYAGGTLAVIVLLALALRRGIGKSEPWKVRPSVATAMIALGLLAVVMGILPVLGFLMVLAGIAVKIVQHGKKSAAAI